MKIPAALACAAAVLSPLLISPPAAWSQDTRGTIGGRVTDSSGAVVTGVSVVATHIATGQSRTGESNSAGIYTIPLLPSGSYQITAEKQGFKHFSRAAIELEIAGSVTIDIPLEVGAASETVTITAESPVLETENASLGLVVDNRRIAELPQPFNNEYLLMILSPGVVNGGGNQSRQQPWEPGSTVDVNMAGSGNKTASITLDGANNTSRDTGSGVLVPGFVPPADAVEEFKVQTVSFEGSTGSTMGGTMNVSLKSGTNDLHATGYYSGVPQDWTANTFFNNKNGKPRSPSQIKRWGGSVNGPIFLPKLYNGRNKTFFMYAYESTRYASPQPATANVPTAAQRTGDFSDLLALGSAYQIYNPFTRRAIAGGRYQEDPIPGNVIPASLISPIATKLIDPKNYPLPNATPTTADGGGNFYTNASQTVRFTTNTYRFDHNFNPNTRMFLNLHQSDATYRLPPWFGENSIYAGDTFGYQMSGFGLDVSHNFGTSLIMDARLSDSRYIRISDASPLPGAKGIDLTAAYGFPAYYNNLFNPAYRRTPNVTIAGYGGYPSPTIAGAYDSLLWYPQENRSAALSFIKVKGINTFKFGFEYRQVRQGNYSYNAAAEGGTFNFDTTYTQGPFDNSTAAPNSRGQGFAAFLMDVPSGGSYQISDSYYEQSNFYGLYLQDDIKVSRKLTLNLSLRYELEGPVTERYNRSLRNFNPTLTHSNNFDALAAAAYAKNPIAELAASQFSTLGGGLYAGVGNTPRELFVRDKNNFMPRIGFAYALNAKTVMRGGFGVYFGPLGVDRGDVITTNFTQVTALVPTNNSGLNFIASMANPYPAGVLPPYRSSLGADTQVNQNLGTLFSPNPQASRVRKVSFSIQRTLPLSVVMDIGYIGSFTDSIATTRNLKFIPSQYLSRLATRDQTLINYLGSNIPNPFYGLSVPGAPVFNATTTPGALLQAYPQFTGLGSQTYEGFNSYHGLNVELRRRFSHGITGQIAYTHSRLMDNSTFLHPDDANPQKVVSSQDFPNHVGSSIIYELPFGRGRMLFHNNRLVNYVAGGWQLSAVWQYQTGAPLGFGDPIFTGDLKSVLDMSTDRRNTSMWFNVNGPGFNTVAAQQFGNHYQVISTRFSWFRAPSQDQVDMSLLKNTKVGEKYNLQFRFDALNALNHVWLAAPNTTASSSSFGQITSENSRSRSIQFMAKFIY